VKKKKIKEQKYIIDSCCFGRFEPETDIGWKVLEHCMAKTKQFS
jgi:hypothetical protein